MTFVFTFIDNSRLSDGDDGAYINVDYFDGGCAAIASRRTTPEARFLVYTLRDYPRIGEDHRLGFLRRLFLR